MGERVESIMTKNPVILKVTDTIRKAAQKMAARDIGSVVVRDDEGVCGILTDRDIVVRVLAQDKDPDTTNLVSVCTKNLVTLTPDDDADEAVSLMREGAVRRIPVVDGNEVVGILSLGDLAQTRDRASALGQISAAPPNR